MFAVSEKKIRLERARKTDTQNRRGEKDLTAKRAASNCFAAPAHDRTEIVFREIFGVMNFRMAVALEQNEIAILQAAQFVRSKERLGVGIESTVIERSDMKMFRAGV